MKSTSAHGAPRPTIDGNLCHGYRGRLGVGPDLEVHAVQRLRVVDASVMPTLVSGNTDAPTAMIAEMAAERIGGR
ncbi:hypothetical protein EAO69_39575 [Streptomyces sp. me109]|uniref:GMC oxidoreductase n=1 Tax=Streptomyces sp. me109 TaxID=1827853 RepID=UPI0011CEBCBB|nr:hypothetical protein EAO69_39575 [Streptomyces sp. me109]